MYISHTESVEIRLFSCIITKEENYEGRMPRERNTDEKLS